MIQGKWERPTGRGEHPDLLDILLDGDNRDPIVLTDGKGTTLTFRQIAVVPLDLEDNGDIVFYAFLRPEEEVEGIADDEAVMFRVGADTDGEMVLNVETDRRTAYAAYDEYLKLCAAAGLGEDE